MAKNRKTSRIIFTTANIIVVIGLAAFGTFYFFKYQNLKNNPPTAEEQTQKEVAKYVKEVQPLYNLPTDETPQLATVKDKEKLKDQPFFEKAENGDVTLIYTNNKLAILYRPAEKKIINVSTVSISDSKPAVAVIGKQTDRATVEATISKSLSNDVSVSNSADSKGSYSGVVVVDVSGKQGELAKKVASALGGQVGTLPEGETAPQGAQIVVIAGSSTAAPALQP